MRLCRLSGSWLIAAALGLAHASGQINVTVDATMDIYQAGGYVDASDGIPPAVFTFAAATPGSLQVQFPSVSRGMVVP